MSGINNPRIGLITVGLAFVAMVLGMGGCTKGGPDNAALVAAGKNIYAASGCARCHALGGQGGRMGPDLTRTGAAPGHTPQWLAEHVRNPKAHNPASRMPAFGRLSNQDLLALGTYLASLK